LRIHAVPAAADQLIAVRRALREWATVTGVLSRDQIDDLDLATYEAMANVVDHAYPDGDGVFDVEAEHGGTVVTVTVADHGQWRTPTSDGPSWRGRGLALIEKLAAQVQVVRNPHGTQVRMHWSCAVLAGP
jgi:serine/threonine-protein kinase RsbW